MKTPKPSSMDRAIEILVENGFVPDGRTQSETFKIITSRSYPLAGALVTLGGRLRFSHSTHNLKVTVGKRTVCFYDVENKIAANFKNFSTKRLTAEDVKGLLPAPAGTDAEQERIENEMSDWGHPSRARY